ncbi:uroporphyrinogen-III C-methyltransferase [Marmoricola endophyticus]|uniref:Uroporphyrinogen-III C-methyltransferase n=1 Tax=Marmoricola endophyticus TaxID=2040280 RepID=A0A917BAL7_9ACTN|nr:uroporphyrinogen-III C-methyltransferase [Marmoricola endophyticus]GGF34060.1 uroporphyrinogen-III C-methyltransferase [Marmoricola endophyticus]
MSAPADHDFVTYPAGLRLAGRRVVVVGGGHVAARRVPALLATGALVSVVSPVVTPAIEGLGDEIDLALREYVDGDLAGAWYAIAATDDPEVNARVCAEAEAARIFCVRADDAAGGSAFTPAVGRHEEVTVAVLGSHLDERDPRRSAAVRDELLTALRDGVVASPQSHGVPGVTLIGGGPGDPDLITVAGRKALMQADVVVADRLAPRELLGELAPDVELIDVTKLPRGRSASQEEINRVIVEHALAGRRVARFKGGDNFVYGRGFEELLACREAGIPVTVVPGLTSSVAVPGVAGVPVTHRGVTHEFTVVSGHLPPGHPDSLVNWPALGSMHGTVVLMMAVQNAPAIAEALVSGGRRAQTPVAVVCDGTMAGERTVFSTLEKLGRDLEVHDVRPPAIIVIGEVVALARDVDRDTREGAVT